MGKRFIIFTRFCFVLTHLFIDFKMPLMSSVIETQNIHVPMPIHVKLAINEVKYEIIMYCIAVAIKYPIGFFVSNGNLT